VTGMYMYLQLDLALQLVCEGQEQENSFTSPCFDPTGNDQCGFIEITCSSGDLT
jgi:hypothetical protein